MDLGTVYIKTAKGQEEVATRAFKLPSRVRNLLVMVDGTQTARHLIETASILGDSAAFFSLLVEEGFVAPATVAVPGNQAAPNLPPAKLVHEVCHLVTDILGPAGDSYTLRLEKARSIEEFAKQVELCRDAIENGAGKKKSDQFWNAVVALLPA